MMIPPYSSSQRQVRSTNASRPSSKRSSPPAAANARSPRAPRWTAGRGPGCHNVSKPRIRCQRTSTSWIDASAAAHVQAAGTLGGGSAIENAPSRSPPRRPVQALLLPGALPDCSTPRAGRADPWRDSREGGLHLPQREAPRAYRTAKTILEAAPSFTMRGRATYRWKPGVWSARSTTA